MHQLLSLSLDEVKLDHMGCDEQKHIMAHTKTQCIIYMYVCAMVVQVQCIISMCVCIMPAECNHSCIYICAYICFACKRISKQCRLGWSRKFAADSNSSLPLRPGWCVGWWCMNVFCVNTWISTLDMVWGLCLCMLWSSSSLSYVHPCIVSYGCHTCCCLTGCGFSCNTCWWLGDRVFICMEIHVSHVVCRLSPTRKRQCEQWLLPR